MRCLVLYVIARDEHISTHQRTYSDMRKDSVLSRISLAVSRGFRDPVAPTPRANQIGVSMHISENSL